MPKPRFEVKLGEACSKCGNRIWTTLGGLFRCEASHGRARCGQKLWIVRTASRGGVRFKYNQGLDGPKRYRGWIGVTE